MMRLKNIHQRFLKPAVVMLLLLLTSGLYASHFRYGDISWRVVESDPTGRTIEFKVNTGWRLNAVNTPYIYFGDGTGASLAPTLTNVNGVYTYSTGTVRHTYAANGNYMAYYSGCCKISNLSNNRDQNWYVRSMVNVGTGNNSPVTTVPAIVNLQTNQSAAAFNIPATDPDGDPLTFSLANYAQHAWPSGSIHPSGLSINSQTGQVTFNTTGKAVGSLWNTAVAISDGNTSIVVDFIIQITQTSTPPQFDFSVTPANNHVFNVSPNQPVNFDIKAFDTDPGSTVSISGIGVPTTASISPGFGGAANPTQHSFSWTPTASEFGTYVMNFIAEDNNSVQTQTSVSIVVSLKPQFDVPPTPAVGSHIVVSPGDLISYNVQASDPDPADQVRIVNAQGKDAAGNKIPLYPGASLSSLPTAAANPTSGLFSWTPQTSDWGHHHVFFTAEDSYGDKAIHEVSQLVNTPPVFVSSPVTNAYAGYTYTYLVKVADPDTAYGDVLSIHGIGLPSWLSLTDNGDGTAVLSGTPGLADAGPVSIQVQAEDMHHHEDPRGMITQSFTINCAMPGDSVLIVSDTSWRRSTIVETANANYSTWPGVNGNLPALATYSLPVVLGDRVDSVEAARAINSESGIRFYRKTFGLSIDTGVTARIRSFMNDGMEVYLNGSLLAREENRSTDNWKGTAHDLKFFTNGTNENASMGGMAFDYVNNYRLDSLVHIGENELVVVLQNKSTNDNGGFSFRMDLKTNEPVIPELTASLVSDINWRKSTVVTPTFKRVPDWSGVSALPADNTFSLPVSIGSNVHAIEGSQPIEASGNITYYRSTFRLMDSRDINAHIRTAFDEMTEVYINGQLLVRANDLDADNRKLPGHSVLYKADSSVVNAYNGGDSFEHVVSATLDTILRTGKNTVTVVVRNRPSGSGGFSFRMDMDQDGSPVIVKKQSQFKEAIKGEFAISLYPNPATEQVSLEIPARKEAAVLALRDLNGKLLWKGEVPASEQVTLMEVSVAQYANGIYFLQYQAGDEYGSVKLLKH